MQWAYSGGADPKPDVAAIVSGIRELVENAEQIAEREAAEDAAAADATVGEQVEEPQTDAVPGEGEA